MTAGLREVNGASLYVDVPRLSRRHLDAEVHTFEDSGHFPHHEEAGEYAAVVAGFLLGVVLSNSANGTATHGRAWPSPQAAPDN